MDYPVKAFGAAGDGMTDDTGALQRAIDACAAAGGGRVVAGSGGVYLTRTIFLKDNVELHVELGGRLLLCGDGDAYELLSPSSRHRRFGLYAQGARNIILSGGGEIDGNGRAYIAERLPHIYRAKRNRPFMFGFVGCENLVIRDIRILDAPVWTITMTECDNVTIHNVSILNDMLMPNNDGIDINCSRNVRISDCHLLCGDDCIVLKTHEAVGGAWPCENITVTNCTMQSRSFAINLGCEVGTPIRNCVFQNCVITDSHRGIGVHLSQKSNVENVIFSNMIVETRYFHPDWWGAAEPIYVVSIPWTREDTVGYVRNIRFSNIICRSENGVIVYGSPEALIERVSFEGVHVHIEKFGDEAGGHYDLRPCEGDKHGLDTGVFPHEVAGFYIHNAQNLLLRDCSVSWGGERQPYHGHALLAEQAKALKLKNFTGEHAEGGANPSMSLADSEVVEGGA